MALTRDFRDTVVARAQRDPRFREMLFTEAINAYLGGDTAAGKAILRDLVNATVGFEKLGKRPKCLRSPAYADFCRRSAIQTLMID